MQRNIMNNYQVMQPEILAPLISKSPIRRYTKSVNAASNLSTRLSQTDYATSQSDNLRPFAT